MSDVVEFLRARLDEDEAAALAAGGHAWAWNHGFGAMCDDKDCPYGHLMATAGGALPTILMEVHGFDVRRSWQGGPHIARWDPARVLAEVAAKRRILEMAEQTYRESDDYPGWEGAVLYLAQPFAEHPDFDPEWSLS